MSKYFVLAAALIVLAVACNKKEEVSTDAAPTVEQTAPEAAPESMDAAPEAMDAVPSEEAPAQ